MEKNNNNDDDIRRNHHQTLPHSIPPMYAQVAAFEPLEPQEGSQALKDLWLQQMEGVEDFKSHQLPLARIKKIMKSDRDVRMISAESPILFAKACEMFVVDLTMRAWVHAEENKRRTLQKSDISAAVSRNFAFDFLLDVVPRDESLAAADPAYIPVPHPEGGVTAGVPYYYPPVVDGSGMYPPQPLQAWTGPWPVDAGDGEDEAGDGEDEAGGNSGGI